MWEKGRSPSVAVVGPGAIGGTVATWLCAAGHPVIVCARTPIGALSIATPDGPLTASPPVLLASADARPVDWVLVATKSHAAESTAPWLAALTGPATRVAVLRNGVEHAAGLAGQVDARRIVPVIVDIPVERIAPGWLRQHRYGTMRVPAGPDGTAFAALFADTRIDVATVDDFTSAAWAKLAINVAGAVSALTDRPNRVAWSEPAARVMRALVAERVAVGRAEGARLADDLPDAVLDHYRQAPPDGRNSLHADRAAGRPLEWDARNGVVGRLGRRHGIATPVSDVVTDLLAAIGDGVSAAD